MMHRELLASLAAHVREGEPDVPSPCVSVCRMDPQRELCEGCLRTIPEITNWRKMDDAGKREVWTLIEQRMVTRAGLDATVDCGSSPQ